MSEYSDRLAAKKDEQIVPVEPIFKKRPNYFIRHWRGELSLGISYWVNSFIGNIVAYSIVWIVSSSISETLNPSILLLGMTFMYVAIFGIVIWQITGTWRSAVNHKETTGRKGWATAAQIMMVLGIFQLIPVATNGTKQIIELVKMSTGTDDASKFELKLISNKTLLISGYLAYGLIEEFENYMKYNSGIKTIQLSSLGGRLAPAMHIGKVLEKRRLNTFTKTYCLSACTLTFMGGKYRIITPQAKLGYHKSSFPGMTSQELRVADREQLDHLRNRGVSRAFTRKAFNTPNNEMWYPTLQELLQENIVTHIYLNKKFVTLKRYCGFTDCSKSEVTPLWLIQTVEEFNLKLPKQIDTLTKLVRIKSGPGKK